MTKIIRMTATSYAGIQFNNLPYHYAVRLRFSIIFDYSFASGRYSDFRYGIDNQYSIYIPDIVTLSATNTGTIITTDKIPH